MSRDADEIRQEIDRARDDLGETLEAIGDRVAPKHVAQRVKDDVDDKIDAIGDKVSPKRIFQRKTEGIRSGLRIRGANVDTSDDVEIDDSAMLSASGNGRTGGGGEIGRQAQNLRQRLRRASGTAVEQVTSVSGAAVEQVKAAPRQARAKSETNPLVTGLVAFGGGLAVAALLPPTDRERAAASKLKDRIEPLKQQAVQAGRSVAEDLKPVAQTSLDQVKGRATEAADEVKGLAQGAAEDLKVQAQQAGATAKGQTRTAAQAVKGQTRKAAGTVKGTTKQAVKGTARQTAVRTSAAKAPATKAPARPPVARTPVAKAPAKRTPATAGTAATARPAAKRTPPRRTTSPAT